MLEHMGQKTLKTSSHFDQRSGENGNTGSVKNRMQAVDEKQESSLEWPKPKHITRLF